ncbi:hypothetical protein [Priestia megaterium]|uniref:hypothetical protein n=1 Tax=Priestia megaterium TaxID=1404 RepID=UPI00211BCF27|nr:hypothetical protein [Priestia megaterium]
MTERKEMLLKLRKYVEEKKNVRHEYIDHTDEGTCYCAVGFLMNEVGFDLENEEFIKNHNGDTIVSILGLYDLNHLKHIIDGRELRRLQRLNDAAHRDDLIAYIDELMEVNEYDN